MKNIEAIVLQMVVTFFVIVGLSGCANKSLSQSDRDSIKFIYLSADNISASHNDVVAYDFVFGAKKYNDIIPNLERNQIYGKILVNALMFQLGKNNLFQVVTDPQKADATFFGNYRIHLAQMANRKDYKLMTGIEAFIVNNNGDTIWKKWFQLMNPYTSASAAIPLILYTQNVPVLHHAIGASVHELSKEMISDLGGTPYDAPYPVWEISE